MLLGLSNEGYFLGDFWKISLGPPFALFQKMRVLGNVAKIAITWSFGTFFSLCIISGYNLQDNDICARVLLAFWSEGYFLGDFWKTSLSLPFALFLKMQVLGDLAIIALTWPFGHFWRRFFAPKSSPVFALEVHTNKRIMLFVLECFWAFQMRATFWAIFENFQLVPPLHFFRKCGSWVTLRKLP